MRLFFRRGGPEAILLSAFLASTLQAATPPRTSSFGTAKELFSADAERIHLDGVELGNPSLPPVDAEPAPRQVPSVSLPSPRTVRLFDPKTVRVGAGILVAAPAIGYFAWWRGSTGGSFRSANERWFQRDTYAGGADKASHFVVGYMAEQTLEGIYGRLGHGPADTALLSLSTVALTGALIELGDGFSQYGFSWEDATANLFGALAAATLSRYGLRDTFGVRYGLVKALIPDACCRFGGYGSDYSKEIYAFDLKLAGLLPRWNVKPGLARFLLVSMTYGSKGYRYSDEEVRERNLGFEAGLNVPEILRAAGVKESSWWGKPLLIFLSYFRIPYTAFGFRYDFNHKKWSGFDTGDRFDPGSIIY